MRLNIDEVVLRKVGELSSVRGDANNARKAPDSGSYTPLSGAEGAWLEQAVRRIIKRLGESATGTAMPQITMADLRRL